MPHSWQGNWHTADSACDTGIPLSF